MVIVYCYIIIIFSDDWKADQVRWRNNGKHVFKDTKIKAEYYIVIVGPKDTDTGQYPTDSGLKKKVYTHINHPGLTYVRYIGDETLIKQFPHQNARTEEGLSVNYKRTNPTVLRKGAEEIDGAKKVFAKSVRKAETDVASHSVDTFRNVEQVRNLLKKRRRECRLTQDALYNMISLELDLACFISFFQVLPYTVIMGYDDKLVAILKKLIGREDLPPQMFTYDTTFKLGDFYLSALIFKQTEFTTPFLVPVAYVMHDRKLDEVHELFFKMITDILPELVIEQETDRFFFVIDQESAIYNAIKKFFPNVDIFRCWNHVQDNCKTKLRGNKRKDEILGQIETMFYSKSRALYMESYAKFSSDWDQVLQYLQKWTLHFFRRF